MRWIVRVARSMDDVKKCYFTDKEKALERMEILKDLSMAVDDATVYILELRYLTPLKRCSSLIASFLLLNICSLSSMLS